MTGGHSPVLNTRKPLFKETRLDFPTALKSVIEGRMITKLEWNNKKIFGYIKDGFLMLNKEDGKDYQWVLSEADLMGVDWIALEVVN